ncbi:winged helix DNA-binding protein [Murinocardiopsis flavida]|uniref:Winged helix DNA-binding protein n=1 Tax=Murinocardiopsis flavida TaxID=645275 RepID=A0A2P8D6G6_9ACTN|nr:winged helix DNA-binding protein [Murinocardiopsis flavida]
MAERWPEYPHDALGWSVQALLPLVHRPPNGTWGRRGATPFTLAEEWIGAPMHAEPRVDALVHRYLAGFGPAGVKDFQAWSGLRRTDEVFDRLRPGLRVYRDEAGRELFDLPDAVLPDPDVPAPLRLLPDFDNVLLAHADRTRVISDEYRKRVCVGAAVAPTILVDGHVRGVWTLRRDGAATVLTARPFRALAGAESDALAAEAAALLAFATPDDAHELRVERPE